jgi:asparagine N-glycosylation enzyme membrane subunit Stt3
MFSFDSAFMLAIIFFANILPGMLLALGLLRNSKLGTIEKLLIGAALGFLLPEMVPFLLSVIGIKFSYMLALASVALMYAAAIISIAYAYKSENAAELFNAAKGIKLEPLSAVLSILLVVLLFFSFTVRLGSISPVYMELDPYFYSYGAIYILEDGAVPLHDSTAWWPENASNHRAMPSLIYLESTWYSFYTHGASGAANPFMLAYIANFYPPIAGALTVFFVYLLFRIGFNRETGLAIAALLSLMPSYLFKTLSGVFEAQPMSFLLYASTLALAYAYLKMRDKGILAALFLLYIPMLLGSTGGGMMPIVLSTVIAALVVLNFAKYRMSGGKDENPAKDNMGYLCLAGALLVAYTASALLQDYYQDEMIGFGSISLLGINALPFLLALALKLVYEDKAKMEMLIKNEYTIYAGILALLIIFMASPFGSSVLGYARAGFAAGSYNSVLERTIAEHQLAGDSLSSDLSALGGTIDIPVIKDIIAFISGLVNLIYNAAIGIVNAAFGLYIPAINKSPSIAAAVILGFMALTLYEIAKFLRDREVPLLFVFVAVMFYPLSIPGMIQAKFTIYFTFAFIVMIGYVFGKIYGAASERLKDFKLDKEGSALPVRLIVFAALFLVFIYPIVLSPFSVKMMALSLSPKFGDSPHAFDAKVATLCKVLGNNPNSNLCKYAANPEQYLSGMQNQYAWDICFYTLLYDSIVNSKNDGDLASAANLRCSEISPSWITALDWMGKTLPPDARVTSWWDYGHWTNFFARKASVIRNEHASVPMIQDIAHAFIMANETETIEIMQKYDSEYLLVDSEILINSGTVFGAKFYALNYLACTRDNLTDVFTEQMGSQCEYDNLWEQIVPTTEPCLISPISQKYGVVAKRRAVTSDNGKVKSVGLVPAYCLGNVTLANGQQMAGTYYLDRKAPSGELMLNRAILQQSSQDGSYVMLYTKDMIWMVNGQLTDGYDDRIGKGRFYDSTVYKGFVLGQLDGFSRIYDNGDIKIYKINNYRPTG